MRFYSFRREKWRQKTPKTAQNLAETRFGVFLRNSIWENKTWKGSTWKIAPSMSFSRIIWNQGKITYSRSLRSTYYRTWIHYKKRIGSLFLRASHQITSGLSDPEMTSNVSFVEHMYFFVLASYKRYLMLKFLTLPVKGPISFSFYFSL